MATATLKTSRRRFSLHRAIRRPKPPTGYAVVVTDNVPAGQPRVVAVTTDPRPVIARLAGRPGRSVQAIDFENDPLFGSACDDSLYVIVAADSGIDESNVDEFLSTEPGSLREVYGESAELRVVPVPAGLLDC